MTGRGCRKEGEGVGGAEEVRETLWGGAGRASPPHPWGQAPRGGLRRHPRRTPVSAAAEQRAAPNGPIVSGDLVWGEAAGASHQREWFPAPNRHLTRWKHGDRGWAGRVRGPPLLLEKSQANPGGPHVTPPGRLLGPGPPGAVNSPLAPGGAGGWVAGEAPELETRGHEPALPL